MSISRRLVGVLHTDSKVKYGVEKGKMIYLFEPYDQREVSSLHVPSKLMHQTTKKYVYVEWEGGTISRGTILDYLGDVGDLEAEYRYLRYICGLQHIKPLKNLGEETKTDPDTQAQAQAEYQVYSIDPPGCRDIDDAFHYDEERHQIGIHIAYPWHLLYSTSLLRIFLQRVSTLYTPMGNIPMMPKTIAEDRASLLEKQKRPAVTILYQLNSEETSILGSEIRTGTYVYVVKNYDYETVDTILQKPSLELSKKEKMLQRWREVSERIFQKSLDAHTVVESWMLETNQRVATELVERYGSRVLLRTMQGSSIERPLEFDVIPSALHTFLQVAKSEGAEYRLYDPTQEEAMRHHLLSQAYYTHFTSPIRRFCDLYNQALLSGTLPEGFCLEATEIDEMNRVTKAMRKYQRMSSWTGIIFSLGDTSFTTKAYLYEIDPVRRLVRLYLTDRGMVVKKYVVQKRFEEITEVIWEEETQRLILKDEDGERVFTLYEEREIRIYLYPHRHRIQDRMEIFFCD